MNKKPNTHSFESILHLLIIFFGIFMVVYIITISIIDIENYITPVYIPIASFIIAVLYFCSLGYSKISLSKAHQNIKANYRGRYILGGFLISLFGLIICVIFKSIFSPLSDILTVIAIILTVSANFITDFFCNLAESRTMDKNGDKY